MRYSIEIGKIVEGAIKRDMIKVSSYVDQLIKKLQEDGETVAANKFKKILSSSSITPLSPSQAELRAIPVDQESRTPLIDIIFPENNNIITILTKNNDSQINEFIETYKCSDKLKKEGLEICNTLLLYGPPGCGKTNTAFMIAKKLNLPLVVTRLDGLISSYLGTTAKNIRQVFEYVKKKPCVLLLDEFDAIAKARDDSNELGELKRVVNSLLQNIDNTDTDCLIIAATNHEKLLDTAVWRRFGYVLQIEFPDIEAIKQIIKLLINEKISLEESEIMQLAVCFQDRSGAYIEKVIYKAMRSAILKDEVFSKISIFQQIFLSQGISEEAENLQFKKASYLKSKNKGKKYFTYDDMGEILGLTKGYISSILKGDDSND
ncbi:MAG: ATP-binding protein [Christensenellaceae bacterium]|jgi:SpoVK/Ycf46/Vps4 family AAA+-type ATPase|nr:ATP-binding protein [Christensenellaceae bacterium]